MSKWELVLRRQFGTAVISATAVGSKVCSGKGTAFWLGALVSLEFCEESLPPAVANHQITAIDSRLVRSESKMLFGPASFCVRSGSGIERSTAHAV